MRTNNTENKENFLSWRIVILAGSFLWFVIAFWRELSLAIPMGLYYISQVISINFDLLSTVGREAFRVRINNVLTGEMYQALWVVIAKLVIYALVFSVGILSVSQFALPVSSRDERKKAIKFLWLFLLGRHGPAIFVKNGRQIAREGEINRDGAGVALVDLNSVVVLRERLSSYPKQTGHWVNGDVSTVVQNTFSGKRFPLRMRKQFDRFLRIAGPGVVFIGKEEEFFNTLFLRP